MTAGTLVLRNDSTTSGNIVLTLGVPGNPLASNQFNSLAASNAFSGGSILVKEDGAPGGLTIVGDLGLVTGTNFNFAGTKGLSAAGHSHRRRPDARRLVRRGAADQYSERDALSRRERGYHTIGLGTITASAAELRNESAAGGTINLGLANNIGTLAAFNNFGRRRNPLSATPAVPI